MKKIILFAFLFLITGFAAYAAGEDDPAVLYNKGIDFYEQDKTEESIAAFKKAISIDPDFYEAYYNLARVQESAGKTKDAILSYEKLLQIQPSDWESTYRYGELLYKSGYLSKANSYLSKIPSTSEYKTKADTLLTKIKKRQEELTAESRIKARQNLKSSVVGNVPAPSGLVIDSTGNMYIASFSESKIIKISKDGTKDVFANKTKGLDGPIGLAIDSYNNIYAANYNKGNVVMYDNKGEPVTLMYAQKPYGISIDEANAKIYVTEQQNNSVISYDISDIIAKNKAQKTSLQGSTEQNTQKVLTVPKTDKTPLGVPTVVESNFTKSSPQGSITAPIMIPSGDLY
ncbi:MAG: tetratricopeptide repeat protein [Candidatus Gastranaerophilales bacterium]|nr:tetratricopeptide repeat protein [Candidatus Gastranaerophilales bacterium]